MNHDNYDDDYIRSILNGVKSIAMVGVGPLTIAEPAVAAADLDDVERFHDRVVEALGCGEI